MRKSTNFRLGHGFHVALTVCLFTRPGNFSPSQNQILGDEPPKTSRIQGAPQKCQFWDVLGLSSFQTLLMNDYTVVVEYYA